MGKGSEQTFLQRRYTSGHFAREQMLDIISEKSSESTGVMVTHIREHTENQ